MSSVRNKGINKLGTGSLRQRLALLIVGVCVLTLFISNIALFIYDYQSIHADRAAAIKALSKVLEPSLEAPLMFHDKKSAREVLRGLSSESDIVQATLLDSSKNIFAEYPDNNQNSINPQELIGTADHIYDKQHLTVLVPVSNEAEPLGLLVIRSSLDKLKDRLRQTFAVSLAALGIGVLLAVAGASIVGRLISKPVVDLAAHMQKVAESKNYKLNFEVSSHDEVAVLVKEFASLMQEVSNRDEKLQNHQSELEERVAARTSELSDEVDRRTKTEDALRQKQELLTNIIRLSPVPIAMFDMDMRYMHYSQTWLQEHNITASEANSMSHYQLFPNTNSYWKFIFERALKGEKISNTEDIYTSRSGEGVYIRWAVQPWYGSDGTQGGIIFAAVRIDDLVKARQAALENSNAKTQFIANMSHELRTPLNGILGFTELLLSESVVGTEQHAHLANVQESGKVLLSVIGNILDFAKLDRGRMELSNDQLSVRQVVEEVVRVLSGDAAKRGIYLSSEIDSNVPNYLIGDELRLKQILLNLAGNGLKFTPNGFVRIRAKVDSTNLSQCTILITVEDSGIGMSNETTAKLFQAFSQADASTTRKFGGTGLGLAICRQLVDLMKGQIGVTSEEGKGSTFFFRIPFSSPKPTKVFTSHIDTEDSQSNPSIYPDPSLKILVAEDNIVNQALIRTILQKAGHKVTIAENGLDAVNAVAKSTFDLILMDIQMPQMGGIEATKAIRAIENGASIPIIALTAHAFGKDHAECLAAGMNSFLTKPINRKLLFETISEVQLKT